MEFICESFALLKKKFYVLDKFAVDKNSLISSSVTKQI